MRPPRPIRPIVANCRPRRLRTKSEMSLLTTVCSSVAVYSTIMWIDARAKRTKMEGKPFWPWNKK